MSQIENSIMLKLRNSETRVGDSLSTTQHASWQTTLKVPQLLEKGDIVKIHTAILDTSAESVIQIDDPLGIDIKVGIYKYIKYSRVFESGADGTTAVSSYAPTNYNNDEPSYLKYFACTQSANLTQPCFAVIRITLQALSGGFDTVGNCSLRFGYKDAISGLQNVYVLKVPKWHPVSHERGLKFHINNMQVGDQGFSSFVPLDSKRFYHDHGLEVPSKNADIEYSAQIATNGDIHSSPYIEYLEFNIPTGRYTPGEIATILNNEFDDLQQEANSVNDPTSGLFLTNNAFLSTIRQMDEKVSALPNNQSLVFYPAIFSDETLPDGQFTDLIDHELFFDATVLTANQNAPYGAPPANKDDIFIGAEQVDINYDDVLKKLNFSIMHFPNYVPSAGDASIFVPGIGFSPTTALKPGGKLINVYGGAAFASLDPPEFWQKQLGFSSIIQTFQRQDVSFNAGTVGVPINVFPLKFFADVGVTVTDVFDGLDVPVPKTARFFAPTADSGNPVLTSLTRPILANRVFDTSERDEGYFLIEVGFKFPQSMVGGQYGTNLTNNNIQSIIGKYYTGSNNFLQDTGAGSITYQHDGDPQILTDINIRVLMPDGTLPSDTEIGPKNTIFLEIIKTTDIPEPK